MVVTSCDTVAADAGARGALLVESLARAGEYHGRTRDAAAVPARDLGERESGRLLGEHLALPRRQPSDSVHDRRQFRASLRLRRCHVRGHVDQLQVLLGSLERRLQRDLLWASAAPTNPMTKLGTKLVDDRTSNPVIR